ncbi:MAG: aldo/keto reductase, partial [Gammaproteobacteria bacterium]|nr:aldo/keto reductase [Gammaproteobacteria bacterium]
EFGIGAPESECRRVFDAFVEAGGNFIDTADIYNAGTSERMLGEFAAANRDYLVLASKYSLNTRPEDPNAGGSHRKNLMQSLNASLRRMGTDYLDLYWVHGWDGSTDLAEVMRALDDQVRAGKILHIGISNAPAWVVATANTLARERNQTPFTAMQLHYNLVERSIERDYFALANAQNMAILPWSPLAGGLLTGKFDRGATTSAGDDARLRNSPRGAQVLQDRNLEVAEAVSAMAADIGCSTAQLALAWMMRRTSTCVVPVIGARNLAQLQDNLKSVDVTIGAETVSALDGLTELAPEYPHTLYASEFFQTMMYGEVGPSIEFERPWA